VLSPRDEWARVAGERWHGALFYTFVLSLVPALAAFVMARNWDLPSPKHAGAATYLASAFAIFVLAGAFWLLARLVSPRATLRRCVQVAAYGATPVLVASVLLVSPVLMIACAAALLHVFYLYYLGVQQLLGGGAAGALGLL